MACTHALCFVQVSILCGHHQLATEINEFPADQVGKYYIYEHSVNCFAWVSAHNSSWHCLVEIVQFLVLTVHFVALFLRKKRDGLIIMPIICTFDCL